MIASIHHTDTAHGLGDYTRKIQNFIGYRVPGGDVLPASLALASCADAPTKDGKVLLPGLPSGVTLVDADKAAYAVTPSAIQACVGDKVTRELAYTINPSDRPDLWVRLTAVGASADPEPTEGGVIYRNALDGIDVELMSGPGRFSDRLIVHSAKVASIRWAPKMSDGLTMRAVNGSIEWRDKAGVLAMTSRAPMGHDSSKTALSLDGRREVASTLSIDRDGYLVETFGDLSKCTLPVTFGLTTTITGTAAIEDCCGLSNYPGTNYGAAGFDYIKWNGTTYWISYFRVGTSYIPVGLISSAAWTVGIYISDGSHDMPVEAFRIQPGNDWTESGACWNYRKILPTNTAWLGGNTGCNTVSDYVNESPHPTTTLHDTPAGYPQVWASNAQFIAWFTGWAALTWANQGYMVRSTLDLMNNYNDFISTEAGYWAMQWDLTYTVGPSSFPNYYAGLLRRVRR